MTIELIFENLYIEKNRTQFDVGAMTGEIINKEASKSQLATQFIKEFIFSCLYQPTFMSVCHDERDHERGRSQKSAHYRLATISRLD